MLYLALPLYIMGVLGPVLLLPRRMMTVQAGVFLGTLLLSAILYVCGGASLWCWSIATVGVTLLIPSAPQSGISHPYL